MAKKTVAVIYGGKSAEHDVSKVSARFVIDNMDMEKYNCLEVYITKGGEWQLISAAGTETPIALAPGVKGLLDIRGGNIITADCVFPMVHGQNGEDGLIAAVCEAAGLPFVGCGALSHGICFDKHYTKIAAASAGVRQAKYVTLMSGEILSDAQNAANRVRSEIDGAVFVKPAASGSSVGIAKAEGGGDLRAALKEAARYGDRVVAEEAITGRELECAVLGGAKPVASGVGEILPANDFYDYDSKYSGIGSKTVIDPDIGDKAREEIRGTAVKLFKALGCYGMARVDFFLSGDTVIFNEINTIPGFTSISMYPMLWDAAGIGGKRLVSELIELAFER